MEKCLFCRVQKEKIKEIESENEYFYSTKDSYPVTPLHTLIVPKRCIRSFFDLNSEEIAVLYDFISDTRNRLISLDKEITAFNIGINDGKDAGQSIPHLHFHLIPRRHGDVENPQGGVRGVIPSKQKYNKRK